MNFQFAIAILALPARIDIGSDPDKVTDFEAINVGSNLCYGPNNLVPIEQEKTLLQFGTTTSSRINLT